MRRARADAPTLREYVPAASLVRVELSFSTDARLVPAPQQFTVYPPASAHFVYACPFGDCDGIYDLNEDVLDLLGRKSSRLAGVRHCGGHRARRYGPGPQCGLNLQFAVLACYEAHGATGRGPARKP